MENILKLVDELDGLVRRMMVSGRYIRLVRRLHTLREAMCSIFTETKKLRAENKELKETLPFLVNKIDRRELKTPFDHKMFDDICQIIKTYKETTKES